MKKLLVTGASGFLGSRIVNAYHEKYHIYAPAHMEMDITDGREVYAAFESFRPDFVIHSAAISDIGMCEKEPVRSWKINVDGSRNIAAASARFHAKCLLCSSDQVYFGSETKGPHCEDESIAPVNLYGKEKKQAEDDCLKEDPECVILRLSWMYDTKTVHEQEHNDFFRTMMSRMKTSEVLSYPVYDVRGITDVNEVVSHFEKAFELPGGIYNFGSPNDRNTYETVWAMFQELGWDKSCLEKNEMAFASEPRNISMCQKKLNDKGIFFSSSLDALVRNGAEFGGI